MNKAVSTDGVDDWVDLGFVTDACITLPETCGPEGAALAFWFNEPTNQTDWAGLITSGTRFESGIQVFYYDRIMR